ncbi:hypothetical protein DXG03_006718 [Asterophora parasitica]|uniref:Uncharacterized protein n=1 Tax=Asterophora parasitica TaxID=117018 RepID=A0A9P7G9E5_9AGAR|nr:hypothetical protein DXG03_006718 [Asterophora parasitica]
MVASSVIFCGKVTDPQTRSLSLILIILASTAATTTLQPHNNVPDEEVDKYIKDVIDKGTQTETVKNQLQLKVEQAA